MQLICKIVTLCEVAFLLGLSALSFSVLASMTHMKAAFAEDMAISPISRFIVDYWVLIHLPLAALVAGVIWDLVVFRRGLKPRLLWMSSWIVVFALLAAVWLLGITLPFWTIP